MHEDLIGLSDRTWGWDDDYAHLGTRGARGGLAHPGDYVRGVARDTWRLLWWPLFLPVDEGQATATRELAAASQLPEPSEGQPIPSASVSGWISTPDNSIREIWTSPTQRSFVFDDPDDAIHLENLERRLAELSAAFPDRDGWDELGTRLNQVSRWFPRPLVWLVVGLVAVVLRRPRGAATPLVLAAAALLVALGTSLAVPATAEYSVPVAPTFVVLACCGLLAPSRRLGER